MGPSRQNVVRAARPLSPYIRTMVACARWQQCSRPPPAAPPPPRASTSSSAASTSASAGIEAGELALFTDGACKGNQNVATSNLSAGWGVCVVSGIPAGTTVGGTVEAERYGQVELNRHSGLFLGAEVGSNNTGELTGVCEAFIASSRRPLPPPARRRRHPPASATTRITRPTRRRGNGRSTSIRSSSGRRRASSRRRAASAPSASFM